MKLARLLIEDFRQFERLELDFTDSLGCVRDLVVLVGPNGSGKTTVLDAIAAAIGPSTELVATRTTFQLVPARVVRPGAREARVTCWLRFSDDEIAATRELFERNEDTRPIPDAREVKLSWTYPDPLDKLRLGFSRCEPANGWTLLKARVYAARLLRTRQVDWTWFKRVGFVTTFDQQRTSFSKVIRRDILDIIRGGPTDPEGAEGSGYRTSDPREILLDLAIRSKIPAPGAQEEDLFRRVQERYADICAPRQILGVEQDGRGGFDLKFSDGRYEYGYEGLSSGEAMVLLHLIKMISERVHRSIVLVDEVELHQHLVWQRRLLHLLGRMGDENQIIATTHSPYLSEVVPRGALIDVGAGMAGIGAHEEDDADDEVGVHA